MKLGRGKKVLGDRMGRELSDQVPTELKANKSKGENKARTWEKCVPGRGTVNVLSRKRLPSLWDRRGPLSSEQSRLAEAEAGGGGEY